MAIDWLKFFRSESKGSAGVAKERLKVVIASERDISRRAGPEYLPRLREELLLVVRKYVQVPDNAVHVHVQREDGLEVLEMNITLPEAG